MGQAEIVSRFLIRGIQISDGYRFWTLVSMASLLQYV